jgi:hypothetical protein
VTARSFEGPSPGDSWKRVCGATASANCALSLTTPGRHRAVRQRRPLQVRQQVLCRAAWSHARTADRQTYRAVIGDKAWATLEPFFRECLAGKPVEFEVEVEMAYQTSDPQFTHCCSEPECRTAKSWGCSPQSPISPTSNVPKALPARVKRRSGLCSTPVASANRGRSRTRPFPPCERRDVQIRRLQ